MVRNRKHHRASRLSIRLEYGPPHHGERGAPPGYGKLFTFWKPQYPDWVFAGTFDDLPDFDVGHEPFDDLEAVDTWAFEHDPTHSSYFPNNYHHNTNMVSTYLTADGGYLPLRYRTSLLPR